MKKTDKTEKIWAFLARMIWFLMVIAEGLLMWEVWKLDVLPGKYLALIGAAIAVVDVAIAFLMKAPRRRKWQNKTGHGRKVGGAVLCLVLILACLGGTHVVSQVGETLNSITDVQVQTALMNVYVLQEDPAHSVRETGDYIYGITSATDETSNQGAVEKLQQELESSITLKRYDSVVELIDALYRGEVDAIILDEAFISVIPSMEGYGDFEENVRLLTEHTVQKAEKPARPPKAESTKPEAAGTKDVTNTPFMVYISGNDARLPELADGASDVNILVIVNPVEHQVLMVNTPRDYYVENPASGNGSLDKLTHCGLDGIDNCVEAMERLYGQDVDYYARINFSGFRKLIDALGGVTVVSEVEFSTAVAHYVQGENHLNGAQALSFARERKAFLSGDNQRGKNQMALIKGLINQLSASNLIANYADILKSLEGMFATTMPTQDIGKLVELQLTQKPNWNIMTFAVTGDTGSARCWAMGGGYGDVMYPNAQLVAQGSDLIRRALAGEVITEEDLVTP